MTSTEQLERVAKKLAAEWWLHIRDENDPFGVLDLERAVAAALAACAREAEKPVLGLLEEIEDYLRSIDSAAPNDLIERCMEIRERAAGESSLAPQGGQHES